MCLLTNRDIWGFSSLILGACTVWGLMSATSSKSKVDKKPAD